MGAPYWNCMPVRDLPGGAPGIQSTESGFSEGKTPWGRVRLSPFWFQRRQNAVGTGQAVPFLAILLFHNPSENPHHVQPQCARANLRGNRSFTVAAQ